MPIAYTANQAERRLWIYVTYVDLYALNGAFSNFSLFSHGVPSQLAETVILLISGGLITFEMEPICSNAVYCSDETSNLDMNLKRGQEVALRNEISGETVVGRMRARRCRRRRFALLRRDDLGIDGFDKSHTGLSHRPRITSDGQWPITECEESYSSV